MANNLMWLVNMRTGEKVFIGKYYPSTGWYVSSPEMLADSINAAFHKVDFGEISYEEAEKNRIPASGGDLGDTSWYIEYESINVKTPKR